MGIPEAVCHVIVGQGNIAIPSLVGTAIPQVCDDEEGRSIFLHAIQAVIHA